jgi:hypothetical protein
VSQRGLGYWLAGARIRLVSVTAVGALLASIGLAAPQAGAAAQASSGNPAGQQGSFGQPTADQHPMARSWWPDAASGESAAGLNLIASHINAMARAGFGGLEIAFLADRLTPIPQSSTLPASQQLGQPGVDQSTAQTGAGQCCVAYTNAEAKTLGFGTQNWQKVLTQIFETADADHLHVDLTLSQHWPVALNDIDPNDPGQQQEAVTAYSPITTADEAAGVKQVPLPPLRLQDQDNVPFVFASTYDAATIMKVASVSSGGVPTFSYASLTDVSPQTSQIKTAAGKPGGYAAGIPDSDWIQANPSSFTGTLTSGSTTVSGVSAIAGATGQAGSILSGPGIPAGTRIVSVGTNSLVMSNAATASATGTSIDARWNINTINADWGPPPPSSFTGKIDAAGDRRRMADWQYEYQTTIDKATLARLGCSVPAPGAALAAGDCVLYGTWNQGTGQTRSGGDNTMEYNREYVTSMYDAAGTQAIEKFWDDNILGTWRNGAVAQPLGDTELMNLIRANAAANPEDALFEDSLELSKTGSGNYWTSGLLGQMSGSLGYDAARYAPLLAGGASFDTSSAPGELSSTRVAEDWNAALGADYNDNHAVALQRWAENTLGYNFKQQVEGGGGAPGFPGVDPFIGIQEGDNAASDDAWRELQGAANLNGSNIVSDEALTFGSDYTTPWLSDVEALNLDWAGGANRVNFHGSPFNETFDHLPSESTVNGAASEWPGWEFQHGSSNGYGVFDARQIYWGSMGELTGYVAHTQSVLQGGVAKPDFAVLEGSNDTYTFPQTNSLQDLLNAGWEYNVIDESMLGLPNSVVTGGVLDAYGPTNGLRDGPAYKAIVISGATELMPSTVERLIGYARAGLPIVFFGSDVTRVYGTNQPGGNSTSLTGNNDTALAADLAKLKDTPNVYTVASDSQTALMAQLSAIGITPAASYAAPGLESVRRQIGGGNYYYLYSADAYLTASATAGATGLSLSSTEGLQPGDKLLLDNGTNTETVTIASIPSPAPASPNPNVLLTAPLTQAHAGGSPFGFGSVGVTAAGASDPAFVSTVIDKPITLAGSGQPYLLDPWTGKVTPIADYTSHDGSVTVRLTITPEAAAIIEVGGAGAGLHATSSSGGDVVENPAGHGLALRATEPGSYTVSLSNGRTASVDVGSVPAPADLSAGWGLTLQSWGPDPAADQANPEISSVTTTTFPANALGSWSSLPATSSQLAALGVASMAQVSGIGYYHTTFRLPADWQPGVDGAYLQFAHGADMVVAVTVNGHPVGQINQITDAVDAGPYLKPGTNAIEVQLDSQFGNRVGKPAQSYGLTGVTFQPYVDAAISGTG